MNFKNSYLAALLAGCGLIGASQYEKNIPTTTGNAIYFNMTGFYKGAEEGCIFEAQGPIVRLEIDKVERVLEGPTLLIDATVLSLEKRADGNLNATIDLALYKKTKDRLILCANPIILLDHIGWDNLVQCRRLLPYQMEKNKKLFLMCAARASQFVVQYCDDPHCPHLKENQIRAPLAKILKDNQ